MGKKRRLNKLISKWIKSDLPSERSSVLLLQVTRAPPSPKPTRRPFSLPLALGVVSSCSKGQVRRNSSSASYTSGRRASVGRRDSRRGPVAKGERYGARPPSSHNQEADSQRARRAGDELVENGQQPPPKLQENGTASRCGVKPNHCLTQISNLRLEISNSDIQNKPCSLEVNGNQFQPPVINTFEASNLSQIRKNINDRRSAFLNSDNKISPLASQVKIVLSDPQNQEQVLLNNFISKFNFTSTSVPQQCVPTTNYHPADCISHGIDDSASLITMETSVDSIGTCSLDMDTSRELSSDWSEVSSTGTLRDSRVLTPSPLERQHQQHHLPSYLSLACTVNGYSTTTNYDPIRLARSRDASPHRIDSTGSYLTVDHPHATYSVTNNLLSPPNLVPLPTPKITTNMTEHALRAHHHQEFYSSTKTVTFLSNESHHYSSSTYNKKDTTDGCIESGRHTIQRKFVTYESKNISSLNDQSNCTIESSTLSKEFTNGQETKSFIQQRVERLYGPGALAQGFFVSKRQKNRISESEDSSKHADKDRLNKTLPDKLLDSENTDNLSMKQSSSSPSLPVLRHLRPEFRAQLPLASPRKVAETQMQKSITVPKLIEEVKMNGLVSNGEESVSVELPVVKQNGNLAEESEKEFTNEKDGHYFLRILDEQASRLLTLADRVESEISTPDLSEEVIGKLRSASGKAKLLVSQKMQQFKGLCTNNINQSAGEAFPTTNEDLQGFWDMVMLQVDQVDRLFEEIDRLRENNWKEETAKKVEIKTNGAAAKPRKAVTKPKPSAAAEEARKQREEQRKKMIEDRRKAMKAAQQSSQPSIEIFVPESS